jgi:hypothetical protein
MRCLHAFFISHRPLSAKHSPVLTKTQTSDGVKRRMSCEKMIMEGIFLRMKPFRKRIVNNSKGDDEDGDQQGNIRALLF